MKKDDILNDFDLKTGSEYSPRETKITSAIEVIYEVKSKYKEFCRDVRQFYTSDGRCIGKIDPLDQFDKIVSDPSM